MSELQSTRDFLLNTMWRVVVTDWEAESYTECWCMSQEAAEYIAAVMRTEKGADVTVQVDNPKRGD